MFTRLLKVPLNTRKSFFLFGPRGTGKTSWLKSHVPEGIYLDLLKPELYARLLAHPEELRSMIPPDFKEWVIIDEVQKVPALLNEVHRLIEEKKYAFILTGSSARSLRKRGVNLLAGRALTYHMHPLTAIEMGDAFRLSDALQFGMLPAVSSESDPKQFLHSYVNTYLREEVLQEGLTRNLENFARFLESASFSQGSILNMSNVARECAIHQKVVNTYFDIVEDLLIAVRIPPFTKQAKRRLVHHSKFFFFDSGVYRILRPMGPMDRPEEAEGATLETLFLQHLRAINDYLQLEYKIYFWKTSHQQEVDFVLYGPRGLIAFEIKRTKHIRGSDLSALKLFKKDYPIAKCYVIFGGNQKEFYQDITAIPFEEALYNLPSLLELN